MEAKNYNLQQITKAIVIVSNQKEKENLIKQADKYLTQFQKSKDAWRISNEILSLKG